MLPLLLLRLPLLLPFAHGEFPALCLICMYYSPLLGGVAMVGAPDTARAWHA